MTDGQDGRPGSAAAGERRVDLIDILRGLALIAMAVYHLTWDLENFGYVWKGTVGAGAWKLFARSIASSFLFLVGVSLVLAHRRGIRWRPLGLRLAQVAAGAAAISLVTVFATPRGFVFFGILHEIALASLLGLAFLRVPAPLTALLGAAAIALPAAVSTPWTDPKVLAWIGLAETPPVSNDYVPLFPWFGVVLLGIAAGRLLAGGGALDALRGLNARLKAFRPLASLGRHALLFYLLHQPILFGLVAAAAWAAPPDPGYVFQGLCRRDCRTAYDAAVCAAFCGCAEGDLKAKGLLEESPT